MVTNNSTICDLNPKQQKIRLKDSLNWNETLNLKIPMLKVYGDIITKLKEFDAGVSFFRIIISHGKNLYRNNKSWFNVQMVTNLYSIRNSGKVYYDIFVRRLHFSFDE